MTRPENLDELIAKYLDDSASEQERDLLIRWFQEAQLLTYPWQADRPDEEVAVKNEIFSAINHGIGRQNNTVPIKRYWPRFAAAASILILLSAGVYFVTHKQRPPVTVAMKTDALPGSNGAILTLADGQKIVIGKNTSQQDLQPANHIQRLSDSTLVYHKGEQPSLPAVSYNTLSTPNGKQFSVTLPDGTRVWMNAGTSLQYPVAFTGKARVVSLSGEAYFEVAHDANAPFSVRVNGQSVNDIGTSFNINGYADEKSTTVTLVDGSASVTNTSDSKMLRPGQQAVVFNTGARIAVSAADMETALAWKNGLFHFDHVSLDAALRQIARWYDLEIVYEGNIPGITIDGEIYRDVKASQLFSILGKLNVNFKIQGNKLIVVQQTQN